MNSYEFDAKSQGIPEGAYVLLADHEAAVAALTQERDVLQTNMNGLIAINRSAAEEVRDVRAERDEALFANELDRRNLHSIVSGIEAEITGRMWMIEGRGSYEWNDDKYRQEFGWAVKALQEKLEPLRKIASDLKNSPTKESGVERVRRLEACEAERDALKLRVEALERPVSDEEWEEESEQMSLGEVATSKWRFMQRGAINALIAARSSKEPR